MDTFLSTKPTVSNHKTLKNLIATTTMTTLQQSHFTALFLHLLLNTEKYLNKTIKYQHRQTCRSYGHFQVNLS